MIVLGFDGGMRNLGVAAVGVGVGHSKIIELGCWSTEINERAGRSDDSTRRAQDLARRVLALRSYAPVAVCAEAFSPPRSAAAAAKVAMVWGVIVAFAVRESVPLFTTSPKALKTAAGANDSSKDAMAVAMRKRWGAGAIAEALAHIKQRSLHEHPLDALATITAWLEGADARRIVNV